MPEITPPSVLAESAREILQRIEVQPKKAWGQNFLTDRSLARELVARANLIAGHGILEIGPGLGALTEMLSGQVQSAPTPSGFPWLYAVEVDARIAGHLGEKFAGIQGVRIIQADILRTDLQQLIPPPEEFQVISNLPYSISTEVFFYLLKDWERIPKIAVMVQREVAERLMAEPGTEAYGRLSLFPKIYFDMELICHISGRHFFPATKVESSFLVLTRRPKPLIAEILQAPFRKVFAEIIGAIFKWRRKTLKNSLKNSGKFSVDGLESILKAAGIDGQRRGETLLLTELVLLTQATLLHQDKALVVSERVKNGL